MNHEISIEEEFARTTLKRAIWGRLFGYFKPHRKALAVALTLEATCLPSTLLEPHLIKVALNAPRPAGQGTDIFVLPRCTGLTRH